MSRALTLGAIAGALCFANMLGQFYRTAMAVVAPELTRDVGIRPDELGFLTGAFFLMVAAMQVPVGILLDRIGPRLTMSGLLTLAVAGTLIFAAAGSMAVLALGRGLIGVGFSAVMMGSLVTFARWVSPAKFAMAASLVMGLGFLGGIAATIPLGLATVALGWRGAFVGMSGICGLGAVLVFLLVRDAPPGHPFHARVPEPVHKVLRGYLEVLRIRDVRFVAAMSFTTFASLLTVLGLWAGPYLYDVHGLDTVPRGKVLMAMAVAGMVGSFAYGPADRLLNSRKRVIQMASGLSIALLVTLGLLPHPGLPTAAVLLTLFCLLVPFSPVVVSHSRSLFPDRLVGRGMTTLNMVVFAGIFLIQWATGFLVDAFDKSPAGQVPEIAYRSVFLFLACAMSASLLVYSRAEDVRPGEELATREGADRQDRV
ncbi:MAG: MFS transporter [Acetobacterales bacterium]